jgi:hypothetical protein
MIPDPFIPPLKEELKYFAADEAPKPLEIGGL